MRRAVLSAAIIVIGLAALGAALLAAALGSAVRANGVGGPFELTAQDGRWVSDAQFRGAPMLVFFGYTHCPDVCPATLSDMTLMLRQLPADAKIAALFITVDPERDTPAALKEYLSSFDPRILGLSGARAELEPVYKSYHVYSKRVPGSGGDYTMDHSALVYIMDKAGEFVGPLDLSRPPAEAAKIVAMQL